MSKILSMSIGLYHDMLMSPNKGKTKSFLHVINKLMWDDFIRKFRSNFSNAINQNEIFGKEEMQ